MSALTMALILFINKVLFFSSILVVVLIVLIRLLYFKKVVDLNKASIESYARQQSRLIEAVRSSETIKLSGGSGAVVGRFASACGDHLRTCRETARVEAVSLGMSTLISNAERVVVLGLGAYLALEGALSVGGLVAISAYGLQLTSRVSRLCDFAVQARVLSVDGNRVSDIVCSEPEKFLYGEHAAPVHVAEVSLNSVSFRYTANDAWVLKDVNFNAGPTEMTIILGVSGSGKTTFIKVLAGLLDPSSGTVGYSGVDVCNMGKTRYRELVQTVLQDGGIFTGTIADNISMFDPDADLD